ncbi:MAG TPA: sulfite exporter TauE/SafE family protein [Hyphomicrobiaceae bacterium]|jgi:uncharacterized membrane protein YfcA|nr:sulfite exporter TauE/SafE family protein [Hyphomicrobiaceae bacterium]
MLEITLIAAVFALAGFVKGTIGLGLPTISMGLLALFMTPLQAAALLVVPSFATNVWQMVVGPYLATALARLWPMMVGVCAGTWAGAGLMSGTHARYGTAILGVALLAYAIMGLLAPVYAIQHRHERWLGPLAGAVTGLITAATGVFVIPAVPYLQAIGLEKEELVQALGLSFTVSTLALAVNLAAEGALSFSVAGASLGALACAGLGMWAGQALRQRLHPATFRRWFFMGLLALALHLIVRAVT